MAIVVLKAAEYRFPDGDGDHVVIDGMEYSEAQLKAALKDENVRAAFSNMTAAVASMTTRNLHYSVYPRYTRGSPAMVPKTMALRIAADEQDAYREVLSNSMDPDYDKAKSLGLHGIVEISWEANGSVWFQDVITEERGKKANLQGAR